MVFPFAGQKARLSAISFAVTKGCCCYP